MQVPHNLNTSFHAIWNVNIFQNRGNYPRGMNIMEMKYKTASRNWIVTITYDQTSRHSTTTVDVTKPTTTQYNARNTRIPIYIMHVRPVRCRDQSFCAQYTQQYTNNVGANSTAAGGGRYAIATYLPATYLLYMQCSNVRYSIAAVYTELLCLEVDI